MFKKGYLLKIMRKNTFGFIALAAVASLGLSLAIAGCGDSGSTAPNPLDGTYSKVIFNYSVLAQELGAKAEIPAHIASVKYAFRGQHEDKQAFVECRENYTYKFTHKDEAYDQKVVIKGVNLNTTEVTAAYYDENNELVAVGVDKLSWDKTTEIAQVEKPTIKTVGENSPISFTASEHVVTKGGHTVLNLTITPNEEGAEPVDITAFASLSGIDEKVLAPVAGLPGSYTGAEYSSAAGLQIAASVGEKIKITLADPIYVTDQVPAAITIVPQPIEGKEVAVEEATAEDPRTLAMLYADESKYVSFGYKVIHFPARSSSETDIDIAVNEQPIKVLVTAYTDTDGKGPQPEKGVSISDGSKLTFETKHLVETPDEGDLNRLSVKDGILYLDGLNKRNNYFQVAAKFDDGSADGLTDSLRVWAQGAVPYTQFMDTESNQLLSTLSFEGPKTYNLKMVGGIFNFTRDSVPLDIPEEMIPADQYPEVAPLQPTTDKAKCYQVEAGKNGYVVEWLGRLEATTGVSVKRPDDAKWPKFLSLYLMRN